MTDEAGAAVAGSATAWQSLSPADALRQRGVTEVQGLSAAGITARRTKYGPNRFAEQEAEPRLRAFLRQYVDAMQIVLLVAGVLSIYPVKQVSTGVMLILLTVLNAYLGLSQVRRDRDRHELRGRPHLRDAARRQGAGDPPDAADQLP